jgi:ribosomal protein S18 acetylase RimI-like enzyme
MALELKEMGPKRVAEYLARAKADYVDELVRAGRSREVAQQNADKSMDEAFAAGKPIAGNEIFDLVDGDATVGLLWLGPQDDATYWVMDIEVDEAFRRKGYGRAAMILAEDRVRELGLPYLGLNVFGHNPNARALYASLGYETTSEQMRKRV